MSANVFAFPGRGKGPQPWTNEELAELYRVSDLLGRAGLGVTTDMGMSDEGDPWFVFCRSDNYEVIAHFARIDGNFIAASIAVDETFRGANFRQIVDRMVRSQPLVLPPSNSGTSLLIHPAVLLTAFVATALAHSEKMMAQDWLKSVEAEWDHGKAALLHEIKAIKTGWLDTLQTLWKLPSHDAKLGHDSSKEGQVLSLASLIAIALVALQPIAEKVAVITQLIADEFSGHNSESGGAHVAHAVQLVLDGTVADLSSHANDHGQSRPHSGEDTPQAHKAAAVYADSHEGAIIDAQKTVTDGAHILAVSAVQKAGIADDAGHLLVPSIEAQSDANGVFLLLQQKILTAAPAPQPQIVETFTVHIDTFTSLISSIGIQDVTSEALQILNIHVNNLPLTDVTSPGQNFSPSEHKDAAPPAAVATVTVAPAVAEPQTLDVNKVSGSTVIQAISNFVTSDTHNIARQSSVTFGDSVQKELAGYFGASDTLKVVFFESTNPIADVFAFSSGVVFVNEKDVSFPNAAHLSNAGGNLTLNVSDGTVTLVGVATIEHATV